MKPSDLFQFEIDDGIFIVITGEHLANLTQTAAVRDSQLLKNRFSESAATECVVDFNQLEYFSSMLLEALLELWEAVKLRKGSMVLCNLSPTGREIVTLSHFDQLWPVCDTREEALRISASKRPCNE